VIDFFLYKGIVFEALFEFEELQRAGGGGGFGVCDKSLLVGLLRKFCFVGREGGLDQQQRLSADHGSQ
jgi:hypothetical protein